MKLNQILKHIEKDLGFQLPSEIRRIYEKVNQNYYVFNTRKVGNHWLLNADYFLIQPEELNTKERGEFFIKDHYIEEGVNILESLNQKVSKSIAEYWSENKVFAFAWSNDVIEKDASLVYVFNSNGEVKGIYVHSLNYVEDKVFLAKSLSDIFKLDDLEMVSSSIARFAISEDNDISSYEDLLKGAYKIVDLESVADVKDYEDIFDIFSSLSRGKFSPMIKSIREQNEVRSIDLKIDGDSYSVRLQGDTDYIDLKIIDFINSCLIDKGHTRRKFIAFRNMSFGQEVGFAFVSKSTLGVLKELKSLEVLRE